MDESLGSSPRPSPEAMNPGGARWDGSVVGADGPIPQVRGDQAKLAPAQTDFRSALARLSVVVRSLQEFLSDVVAARAPPVCPSRPLAPRGSFRAALWLVQADGAPARPAPTTCISGRVSCHRACPLKIDGAAALWLQHCAVASTPRPSRRQARRRRSHPRTRPATSRRTATLASLGASAGRRSC